MANAFITPLLMAALAAAVPDDRLGRALGWFGALQAAGATSAPLLGGLVAEADWRLAFAGVAVVAAALALAWAVGGVATQLVLVGVTTLVLGTEENRGGAVSVVQALRFGGWALSAIVFTPIYHADPLVGFLLPAALLAVIVPAALPRRTSAKWLC